MAAKKKSSKGLRSAEMRNEDLAFKQAKGLHSFVSPSPKAAKKKVAAKKSKK